MKGKRKKRNLEKRSKAALELLRVFTVQFEFGSILKQQII
jgi:hypothetical protein